MMQQCLNLKKIKMKLYYQIWVDCILKAKSRPQNKNDWKIYTLIFMSMAMAPNTEGFEG